MSKRKPPKLPKPRVEYQLLEGDGRIFLPVYDSPAEAKVALNIGRHRKELRPPSRVIVATTTYRELETGQ